MSYKTITLELLQEQPELYEQYRSTKRLLPAMDAHAIELRASHRAAIEAIARRSPESDPSQVASEALELAIRDLRERLLSASPKDEAAPLSPGATSGTRRRTPPA